MFLHSCLHLFLLLAILLCLFWCLDLFSYLTFFRDDLPFVYFQKLSVCTDRCMRKNARELNDTESKLRVACRYFSLLNRKLICKLI